jgi:hypothetical protein
MNARTRTHSILTRTLLGIAAAASPVVLTAAPATAEKPFEDVLIRFTAPYEEKLCGLDVETTLSAREHLKGKIGPNGLPRFHGKVSTTVTWYNPETGRSLTSRDRSNFKDLSVTDNGGGTMTVVWQTTGIPFEIRLDDGTAALKDVGRIVFSTVLDYNGTRTNANDDEFISQEILSISGPHAAVGSNFTMYCSTVVAGLT